MIRASECLLARKPAALNQRGIPTIILKSINCKMIFIRVLKNNAKCKGGRKDGYRPGGEDEDANGHSFEEKG